MIVSQDIPNTVPFPTFIEDQAIRPNYCVYAFTGEERLQIVINYTSRWINLDGGTFYLNWSNYPSSCEYQWFISKPLLNGKDEIQNII